MHPFVILIPVPVVLFVRNRLVLHFVVAAGQFSSTLDPRCCKVPIRFVATTFAINCSLKGPYLSNQWTKNTPGYPEAVVLVDVSETGQFCFIHAPNNRRLHAFLVNCVIYVVSDFEKNCRRDGELVGTKILVVAVLMVSRISSILRFSH